MKKLVFLLFAVVGILFVSCEGPPGKDATGTYWFVKDYTIQQNAWQLVNPKDSINSYYRAAVSIPELTTDIYEDGHVFCYMFQSVNDKEVQTILPFVNHYGERDNSWNAYFWTETYSYDFYSGGVTFYLTYSDFATSVPAPTCTFRVVLNY
jgi:hypothetical protein